MSTTADQTPLSMDDVRIDPAWALRIPANLALRRKVLPFAFVDEVVHVACLDNQDLQALQAVERYVELPILPRIVEPESLERAVHRIFGSQLGSRSNVGTPIRSSLSSLKAAAEPDADDVVALCDELLHAAVIREASDLHIDGSAEHVRVRMRVDGQLEEYRRLPRVVHAPLVSRLKVLAGMDIAERRAPQDGRFTLTGNDGDIDLRIASLPTRHGERITIRFLATRTGQLTLDKLGMSAAAQTIFESAISKPYGLVLLTGPTGSGKSTTLYAAIRRLIAQRSLNVVTIEDPVEYEVDGIAQVEVDSADKVSFGKALRSVLRHDPDVVMIGEIRDAETADIAIKSALTGHLVFSTLHTNSASNAITRLVDMGVEPFLIAATLRLAVAQRLVRRLCQRCKQQQALSAGQARALGNPELVNGECSEPGGCVYCAGRGLAGRVGLFEMLPIDEDMSRMVAAACTESDLVAETRRRQIPRLIDDAVSKLHAGQTTVAEVLAATTIW